MYSGGSGCIRVGPDVFGWVRMLLTPASTLLLFRIHCKLQHLYPFEYALISATYDVLFLKASFDRCFFIDCFPCFFVGTYLSTVTSSLF